MRSPLVPITLAVIVGIILGTLTPVPSVVVVILGLLGGIIAMTMRGHPSLRVPALLALWMCLGVSRVGMWRAHPAEQLKGLVADEAQAVRLYGVIVSDPTPVPPHPQRPPEDALTCLVRVRDRRRDAGWEAIDASVRATIQSPRMLLAYGDEIVVEGEWSRVPAATNPGQYDWRGALARQHIHVLLRVRPFHGIAVLRRGRGWPWVAAVVQLRHRWEQAIQATFEPSRAGLLQSFLLGERVALDDRLRDAFIETGTMHMVVISGFNVGLIALLFETVLRLLGLPWRVRVLVSGIGLIGYCMLTGMQPPVVRATIMAWVVLGALWLDRVISWPNTLAAAALAILFINPTQLFDPGFQLSFGAVLSLLVFCARWAHWLQARVNWLRPEWLRRYLAVSVAATTAIWVGLSPVLAWYFHLVSPIAILANLLVAPLVSALVACGTLILIAGTIWAPVVQWMAGVLRILLDLIVWIVCWCQRIPGGHFWVAHPSVWWLLVYYGLVMLSVVRRRVRCRASRVAICWLAAATLWAWSGVMRRAWDSRWLRLDLLDVGHSDSMVIRTPRGSTILIDAGSQEAGRYRLIPFLRREGITTIDALLLTHSDEDHLGGAIPILQQMRVKRLLTNGAVGRTATTRALYALVAARHVPESVVTAGLRLTDGSDVTIDVLHPPDGFVPRTAPTSNDNSIVLKLTKGSVTLLLTGDLEARGAPWLLRTDAPLRSTVLKVPHHGSSLGAAGSPFFNAVHPQVALLSVGRLHHLPSADTVHALEAAGARLYSTRTDGAMALRTDGTRLHLRTFKGRKAILVVR
ncbi:MAG: DNA internalization-related competence protein ComEC/Rec2 [Candidatus Omnitrophica bacterium]|nr:DNA internalization-related competence protein ComEC/Rec2 [Candidatus Omnitrophota bacterium]